MKRLNDLKINEMAIIKKIDASEDIRKRLFDIGFVKGVKIKPVFVSLGNDMVAYNIKGTVMAVRKTDTEDIFVEEAI